MRFSADQGDALAKYKKALDAAADAAAVRQVLKTAQKELAHAAYHELGKLARAKMSCKRQCSPSPLAGEGGRRPGEGDSPATPAQGKKGTKS